MTGRKKLIEILMNTPSPEVIVMGQRCGKALVTMDFIADHLIANGVTVRNWIPVSERLPEELQNVLAYTDVGSFAETAHWTGHRWEKTWDFEVLYGVTHWMPLPEPPKEDN